MTYVYVGKYPEVNVIGIGHFSRGIPTPVSAEKATLLQNDPDFQRVDKDEKPKKTGGK